MADSPAPSTPYEQLGGDEAVRRLVDVFYDHMERDPEYEIIRALHPPRLNGSREKLYLFLSGWLGGPPLYIQRHGHPRLRARHLPFSIGVVERDQWLSCMTRALDELDVAGELRALLDAQFAKVADFMRNRPEPEDEDAKDQRSWLKRLLVRR